MFSTVTEVTLYSEACRSGASLVEVVCFCRVSDGAERDWLKLSRDTGQSSYVTRTLAWRACPIIIYYYLMFPAV